VDTQPKTESAGLLSGMRVLDLSVFIQGPLATSILGDMGADVIKLEKPGMGDYSRGGYFMHGVDFRLPGGSTMFYQAFNRNKRGLSIDLGKPRGREVLHRLIKKTDVFVAGLQPSSLKRFGADHDTLTGLNPQLVYAVASGFGPEGPEADAPANDPVGCARSGFMYTFGEEPNYAKGGICDAMAATSLAFGIVSSLFARSRDGVARSVSASLLGAMTWLQYFGVAVQSNLGHEFEPWDRKAVDNPLMNFYPCADGRFIMLGLYTDIYWHPTAFCEEMGIKHLQNDPRFSTMDARKKNGRELIAILDQRFITRTSAEWTKVFRKLDLPFSLVNRLEELHSDPQIQANQYIVPFENGFKFAASPFKMEKSDMPLRKGAPELGQHTEEILLDLCGYTWPEIEDLTNAGAI